MGGFWRGAYVYQSILLHVNYRQYDEGIIIYFIFFKVLCSHFINKNVEGIVNMCVSTCVVTLIPQTDSSSKNGKIPKKCKKIDNQIRFFKTSDPSLIFFFK